MIMRRLLSVAMVGVAMGCVGKAAAGPDRGRFDEYQVKAAFIYNFAKFIAWPDAPGPLVIGVVGEDPFGEVLDNAVRGKTAAGRPIKVRRLGDNDEPNTCNIVFISTSEKRRVAELLRRAGDGVLTVGELPQFSEDGGIVRFFLDNNRVRFQINARAADRAGLKIHSQLLSLAAH
jgi:YfiR/HmsC-like